MQARGPRPFPGMPLLLQASQPSLLQGRANYKSPACHRPLEKSESMNGSRQVPGTQGSSLARCQDAACQTLVSGYNLQLPSAARVLSKAQLREIKFMGVI